MKTHLPESTFAATAERWGKMVETLEIIRSNKVI
jgi:hypothetical protein